MTKQGRDQCFRPVLIAVASPRFCGSTFQVKTNLNSSIGNTFKVYFVGRMALTPWGGGGRSHVLVSKGCHTMVAHEYFRREPA